MLPVYTEVVAVLEGLSNIPLDSGHVWQHKSFLLKSF